MPSGMDQSSQARQRPLAGGPGAARQPIDQTWTDAREALCRAVRVVEAHLHAIAQVGPARVPEDAVPPLPIRLAILGQRLPIHLPSRPVDALEVLDVRARPVHDLVAGLPHLQA